MNHIFVRASDASFGDDLVSRKSTEGYLFTLFRRTGLFEPVGRWTRKLSSSVKIHHDSPESFPFSKLFSLILP